MMSELNGPANQVQEDQLQAGRLQRASLQADCSQCFGLCCVALPFAASVDFAADKPSGQACPNLREDFRCGVHQQLRTIGYRGCTVYDCFGAGQKVSMLTYGGTDWRKEPALASGMYGAFPVMRHLHELLWYLAEAAQRPETASIHGRLRQAYEETEQLTLLHADELRQLDVNAHRDRMNELLLLASEQVRSRAPRSSGRRPAFRRGADLIGAKLRGTDLQGANLRGALLIAADLREANLCYADLIGADFRDARLDGADLSNSLFLTQFQVNAAKGNSATRLPADIARPPHWTVT